jgi:hypothetical protein
MGAAGAASTDDSASDGASSPPEMAAPAREPMPDGSNPADGMRSRDPPENGSSGLPVPPLDDTTCATEPAIGYCVPSDWVDYIHVTPESGMPTSGGDTLGSGDPKGDNAGASDDGNMSGEDGPGGEPPRADAPSGESAEEGAAAKSGCTASPGAPTKTAWSLLGLLLLAPLMSRRRTERTVSGS